MGILVILFEALIGEMVVWDEERLKSKKPLSAGCPGLKAGEEGES
jgi:hypothetical protein